MFYNIRKKDVLYRNNKLLMKIWDNLKNINEENKNENEVLRQFINNDIINLAFNEIIITQLTQLLQDKNVIIDIGCGAMTWFYDILYELKHENNNNVPLLIGIDILDFKTIIKSLKNDVLIHYNKDNYNIDEFLEDNFILKNYDINLYYLYGLHLKKNITDFIYQRDMITVYNNNQWDLILNSMYDVLKINGCIQLIEFDINIKNNISKIKDNKISNILNESLMNIFKNNNIEIDIEKICKKVVNKFGNENVKIIKRELPLYNEDVFNNLMLENMKIGYQYFKEPFIEILKLKGIINEKISNFNIVMDIVIKEWEENRSYMDIYCIIAKKANIS